MHSKWHLAKTIQTQLQAVQCSILEDFAHSVFNYNAWQQLVWQWTGNPVSCYFRKTSSGLDTRWISLIGVTHYAQAISVYGLFHQICDSVNCYIRKCTICYPSWWLLINIVAISYWRWRDWFHSNLKNNCECALIMKGNGTFTDVTIDIVTNRGPTWWNDPHTCRQIYL